MKKEIVKLVTFVPENHADILREAIGKAGAGILGNYDNCTFSIRGIGRFRGLKGSNPAIGKVGILESVNEERIEVTVEKDSLEKVIEAIKSVHPYEEIPIDIYPLL
jgi:hypothetical protein